MKNRSLVMGALLGGFSALTLVALMYLGERLAGLPFAPFEIFDWMARVLPGGLITLSIDILVQLITRLNLGPTSSVAKLAEQSIAILQFIVAGVILGVVLALLGRRRPGRLVVFGALGGVILAIPIAWIVASLGFPTAGAAASLIWLAAVFVGWGSLLGWLLQITAAEPVLPDEGRVSRRQFLYLVGAGSFTIVVSALGLSILDRDEEAGEAAQVDMDEMIAASSTSGPAASPPEEALAARFEPVPGTRPEVTSNDQFYRIDINTRPPQVDGDAWRLEVSGLVEKHLSLSLGDLRKRPAHSQFITLECISNTVGGDLISTSLWTGVRLKELLAEAGLRQGAQEVYIESEDGFYESVPMEEAMDDRTLLVYEMNGEPLPVEHGFPLRIYIPNHYGMKQPKWITRLEVIDQEGAGYWVDRGWSAEAIPHTTSVIDIVGVDAKDPETGEVPVGGIAYAGARGISKVEVQVDQGPWEATELRSPPLSPLTWVQWRYHWKAAPGRHNVRVRAYDGTGALQDEKLATPHPNGATGIHSLNANISG